MIRSDTAQVLRQFVFRKRPDHDHVAHPRRPAGRLSTAAFVIRNFAPLFTLLFAPGGDVNDNWVRTLRARVWLELHNNVFAKPERVAMAIDSCSGVNFYAMPLFRGTLPWRMKGHVESAYDAAAKVGFEKRRHQIDRILLGRREIAFLDDHSVGEFGGQNVRLASYL